LNFDAERNMAEITSRQSQWLLIVFGVMFPLIFNPFADSVNVAFLQSKMIFLVVWNVLAVAHITSAKLYVQANRPSIFLILFLLASLVSTLINGDLEHKLFSPHRFDGWFSWVLYVLLFVNASVLSKQLSFPTVLKIWPFAALPAAIMLLAQGYFGTPEFLERLVYSGGFPGGTFGNRAGFSGFATLLVVPGLIWASRAGVPGLIGLGVFGWAIGLAQARGAWIGILFGVVALVLYFPRKAIVRNVLALGIGFSLAFVFSMPSLKTHFESPDSGRLILWRAAVQAIVERPLFGWGVGGFSDGFAQVADWRNDPNIRRFLLPKNDPTILSADLTDHPFPITRVLVIGDAKHQTRVLENAEIDKAHNEYLDLFLAFGVFAPFFWVLFLLEMLRQLFQSGRTPRVFAFSIVSMCVFHVFWMSSITFFPYFWFMAGILTQDEPSGRVALGALEIEADSPASV
jgi:O-antigen ligase